MEPITLVVGGVALYKFLSSGKTASLMHAPATATAGATPISADSSGTGQRAPMATGASIAAMTGTRATLPIDLAASLDNDSAMQMRAYAALNPAAFQAFLDKYTDRLKLRGDLMIETIDHPPTGGYAPTPEMIASLANVAYKFVQAINGVAVGRSVDVFGLAASAAGQLPGINPDMVSALQGMAMTYRAITASSQVLELATANGLEVMNMTSMVAAGAYPGLAALPLAGTLMAVGLVVDIGFTIIGDKPDMQKAIDVALDVASLAVLFIPVIGWIVAIVIQLVKFIIDLFGDDLFGGGMSHDQREAIEAARYGQAINPMLARLSHDLTPRELFNSIVQWGSGYCGGVNAVAMSVNLILKAGDTLMVGGRPYTVPADTMLAFGDNTRSCYWLQGGPFASISNDEQAWALGAYASVNGIHAVAQAGIADALKAQFDTPTQQIIMARAQSMRNLLVTHRLSLDQVDQIVLEYRAQPHLHDLAATYGFPSWQDMFAFVVDAEWQHFQRSVTHGSLADFAKTNGYPTMYAFRAAALGSFEAGYTEARALTDQLNAAYNQAVSNVRYYQPTTVSIL